jgi:hypothetical protein
MRHRRMLRPALRGFRDRHTAAGGRGVDPLGSVALAALSRALLPPAEMLVIERKRGPACAAGSGGMEQPDRPSEGGVRLPRLRGSRRLGRLRIVSAGSPMQLPGSSRSIASACENGACLGGRLRPNGRGQSAAGVLA